MDADGGEGWCLVGDLSCLGSMRKPWKGLRVGT